jgi:hypothetical protein
MNQMKSNPLKTMLTISMGFLLIYVIWKYQWALGVSIGIGLIGMFSLKLSILIEKIWMKLAIILSFIVPNIILGLVFFGFLLPIALLSRVFKKEDSLRLKNKYTSVYQERNKVYDQAHFENMW